MSRPLWNLFLINLIPANWSWSIRVSHPPWFSCLFLHVLLGSLPCSWLLWPSLCCRIWNWREMVRFSFIFGYLLHVCTRLLLTVVSRVHTFSSQLCPLHRSSLLWVCSSLFLYFNWWRYHSCPHLSWKPEIISPSSSPFPSIASSWAPEDMFFPLCIELAKNFIQILP